MRYEVRSELNPTYDKTGNMADYYGIYYVVEYDGDIETRVVKTFGEGLLDDRKNAYALAGRLTNAAPR